MTLDLVCYIGDECTNDDPRLTLTYIMTGQICFQMHLYGTILKCSFYLKSKVKVEIIILDRNV